MKNWTLVLCVLLGFIIALPAMARLAEMILVDVVLDQASRTGDRDLPHGSYAWVSGGLTDDAPSRDGGFRRRDVPLGRRDAVGEDGLGGMLRAKRKRGAAGCADPGVRVFCLREAIRQGHASSLFAAIFRQRPNRQLIPWGRQSQFVAACARGPAHGR